MTKEQFISLLRTPSTINLNMVRGLEEITERFPYFQNAHLLLAKQYQGHQNIRYESYLRKAAAYASDRRVLYDLIKLEPQEVIHIEPEAEEKVMEGVRSIEPQAEVVREKVMEGVRDIESQAEEKVMEGVRDVGPEAEVVRKEVRDVVDEEVRDADVDAVELREGIRDEEIVEATVAEENNIIEDSDEEIPLILDEEEGDIGAEAEEVDEKVRDVVEEVVAEKKATDPKEIIAKRLRELEQSKEPVEIKSKDIVVPPVAKAEEALPLLEKASEVPTVHAAMEPIPEEPEEPEFVRVRREQREPREPRDPKLKVEEQHSFLEWLKLKDIPVIPTERVSEYFKKEDVTDGDLHKPGENLIDQFIKTEPRIVPARSEFYSPGNMARQSAVDHEDLISETLARIYAQQGNIPKAIDAYKRLSLKIPEKSAYFAALIKDLKEKDQT